MGLPNAVLSGTCQSCRGNSTEVSLLLLIASPTFNATTGQLTFSATKLPGWDAKLDPSVNLDAEARASGVIRLSAPQLVIDNTEGTLRWSHS